MIVIMLSCVCGVGSACVQVQVHAASSSGCQIPWSGLTWVPGVELGSLQGTTSSELPSHFFRPLLFHFPFFCNNLHTRKNLDL